MLKRSVFIGLVGVFSIVLGMGSAYAHVESIDIDSTAPLGLNGTVRVSGSVVCTSGDSIRVNVSLTQGGTSGKGRAAGSCSGGSDSWLASVKVVSGGPFTTGEASACAVGRARDGSGNPDGSKQVCETVTITS